MQSGNEKFYKNKRPQPEAGVRQTEDAIFGAVKCFTNIKKLFPQNQVVMAFPPSRFSYKLKIVAEVYFLL